METEVIINKVKEQPKVWSSKQIFFGTAFGGFLSGYFLIRENYRAMGQDALSKKALIIGIVSTIIFFCVATFVSEIYVDRIMLGLNVAIGVVGGSFLMYEYYKTVHQWRLLKGTLLLALIAPPVLVAIPFLLPDNVMATIPRFMIFLMQAVTIQGAAQLLQEQPVKELVKSGSKKHSNWRLFLITFIAFVAQIALLFVLLVIGQIR